MKTCRKQVSKLGGRHPKIQLVTPPPSVDVMATTDKLTYYISQGKAKRTLQFLRLCARYLQGMEKKTTCE